MTTLEIILLILGALIFIGSFIVPESKSEMDEVDRGLTQEQVQEMLKEEVKGVRSQVEDTVEETVSYSMERTERALERITNEKLTAISEYTETVLTDIHKSHEEVLFLFDMLNDKHQNIKDTATEVNKAVKEANEAMQEADIVKKEVSEAAQALDEAFKPMELSGLEILQQMPAAEAKPARKRAAKETKTSDKTTGKPAKATKKPAKADSADITLQFDVAQGTADNNNERILELHQKGKSNVAIAKELGLGVGEVKLVIDLFKGI